MTIPVIPLRKPFFPIPEHLKDNVNRQIMELTTGKVEIQIVEMLSYGIKNKELIVLN
jgi:hypothetical protein